MEEEVKWDNNRESGTRSSKIVLRLSSASSDFFKIFTISQLEEVTFSHGVNDSVRLLGCCWIVVVSYEEGVGSCAQTSLGVMILVCMADPGDPSGALLGVDDVSFTNVPLDAFTVDLNEFGWTFSFATVILLLSTFFGTKGENELSVLLNGES